MEQICLALLCLLLLCLLAAIPKAPHQAFWYLRVGVPEFGALFFLAALPPALWLARKSPKFSLTFLLAIAALSLYPWVQAWLIARRLPARMQRAFPGFVLQRHPLALGPERVTVTVTSEEYKDRMLWDRYLPSQQPVRARILFVHGGSWRNGTRKDYPQLLRYLAARGYEVISLTYRLAPEHPYPAAPEDLEAAIEKLVDPAIPLFLAGRSSGGHLALLASYRKADKVAGVVAFYPPVDMMWSWQNPSNPAVLNSQEALEQFLGGTPWERPELYQEASPIHQVGEDGPPTLLIHGGRDCLVYLKQSQMLSTRLIARRVPHYLLELPWTEHGGDITVYGPTGVLSAWAIESFIENRIEAWPQSD
jgi:acetyl esterase/lipase